MEGKLKAKLSLDDLRVESFITTPMDFSVEGLTTCGMTCTSRSCDGAGPTCVGCSGTSDSCCSWTQSEPTK